jgi:glycosyltransferase involved in cell wall biosynthesis
MYLSIIIPIYNERNTLSLILDKIYDLKIKEEYEIILVDDGSTDGTKEILRRIEGKKNHHVIYKDSNSGKGESLKIGFKKSIGDYVIVQDADLEYNPADYVQLLDEIKKGSKTVVFGSRFMGEYKDMSSLHYFGNKILTIVTNILYGVTLTDMETCYKIFPGTLIRSINLNAKRFEFEPEVTAKILKRGYKIKEVPISYLGRTHSEGKKITWKDGFSAIFSLIKYRFLD